MFFSFALIFIAGLLTACVCRIIRIPPLVGMLLTGILIGPYGLNIVNTKLLSLSPELRQTALLIILMRAGLSLEIDDLRQIGRSAFFMSFIPALTEMIAIVLCAPLLLGLSVAESALLGTVIAAVSPAVIVPKMLFLMKSGYGTNKKIPHLIMAGASLDDIFVIVLFTVCMGFVAGKALSYTALLRLPTAVCLGCGAGMLLGKGTVILFSAYRIRHTVQVLLLFSISFVLISIEAQINAVIGFSGLIAIIAMGITIKQKNTAYARQLAHTFSALWLPAEILLFTLVGAALNIQSISHVGVNALVLVSTALIFRLAAVPVCLAGTALTVKERLFCAVAYIPKATVQAAIGSIPLGTGFTCGNAVLSTAVIAILLTAPIGSFLIDRLYTRWLTKI